MLLKKNHLVKITKHDTGEKTREKTSSQAKHSFIFQTTLQTFSIFTRCQRGCENKKENWGRKPKCHKGFLKEGRVEFSCESLAVTSLPQHGHCRHCHGLRLLYKDWVKCQGRIRCHSHARHARAECRERRKGKELEASMELTEVVASFVLP